MALDLVSIGFDIQAKGIKDANKAVDDLLDKVGKLDGKKVSFTVDANTTKKEVADTVKTVEDGEKKVRSSKKKTQEESEKQATRQIKFQTLVHENMQKGMSAVVSKQVAGFTLIKNATNANVNAFSNLVQTIEKTTKSQRAVDRFSQALANVNAQIENMGKGLNATQTKQLAAFKVAGIDQASINQLESQFVQINKLKQQERELNKRTKAPITKIIGQAQSFKLSTRIEPAFVTQIKDLTKQRDEITKVFTDEQKRVDAARKEGEKLFDAYLKLKDDREAQTLALQKQKDIGFKNYNTFNERLKGQMGGGILDTIGASNPQLNAMREFYAAQERIISGKQDDILATQRLTRAYEANGFTKAQSNQLTKAAISGNTDFLARLEQEFEITNKINAAKKEANRLAKEAEKAAKGVSSSTSGATKIDPIAFEQSKLGFVGQGFKSGDASKLAKLELSGADVATIETYKQKLRDVKTALDELNAPTVQAVSRTQGLINTMGNIAKFAVLSTVVYGLIEAFKFLSVSLVTTADQFAATQARIGLYIKDAEQVGKITNDLAKISIATNAPLKETAALFAKITPVMQKMGRGVGDTTEVVRAFTSSFRISGATLRETEAATIQFAQAMASGRLQGDEFRTMGEAAPRFLKAIVDGAKEAAPKLGITTENVKELASQGVITSEVITKSLLAVSKQLRGELLALGFTFEQGVNALSVGFTTLIGNFNEGAGITEALGTAMAELGFKMVDGDKAAKAYGVAFKEFMGSDGVQGLIDLISTLTTNFFNLNTFGVLAAVLAFKKGIQFGGLLRTQLTALSLATAESTVGMTKLEKATFLTGTAMQKAVGGIKAFVAANSTLLVTLGLVAANMVLNSAKSKMATEDFQEQAKSVRELADNWQYLNEKQRENKLQGLSEDIKIGTKDLSKFREEALAVVGLGSFRANANRVISEALNFDIKDKISSKELIGDANLLQLSKELQTLIREGKDASSVITELSKQDYITPEQAKELRDFNEDAKLKADALKQQIEFANKLADAQGKVANSTYGMLKANQDFAAQINVGAKEDRLLIGLAKNYPKADKGLLVDMAKLMAKENITGLKSGDVLALKEARRDAALAQEIRDAANPTKTTKGTGGSTSSGGSKTDPKQSFLDQIAAQSRLNALLQQGVDYDIAKIASAKDYIAAFGTQLGMAEKLNQIEQQKAYIESTRDLEKSLQQNNEIVDLVSQGFSVEKARAVVGLESLNTEQKKARLQELYFKDARDLSNTLNEQRIEQQNILTYVKQGYNVEEAKNMILAQRLDNIKTEVDVAASLNEELNQRLKTEKEIQGILDVRKALEESQKTFNTLLNSESVAVADLKNQYSAITNEQAKTLINQRKAIDYVKQYYDEQERAKANPLGDFSNVDFSVFGDFGNPFKEAIDGLNTFIGGAATLKESFTVAFDEITTSIDELINKRTVEQMFGDTNAADALTEQIEKQTKLKLNLEKDYEKKKSKLSLESFGVAIKASKGFFKEQSTGYKVLTKVEKAYNAFKIASELSAFALKEGLTKKDLILTIATNAKKQVSNAITALSAALTLPPPANFAAFAAVAAVLGGLGIAISGGREQGSFAPENQGTGTVFGDTSAKSESIKKSIDLLAENSKVELPLTSEMLKSLRNIESNIGGLTNLLVRNAPAEGLANSVGVGLKTNSLINNPLMGLGLSGGILGKFFGLDKILGSAFGTKTTVKGQGLLASGQSVADIASQGFQLSEYVDVNRKKKFAGLTTSNKNSTVTSAADAELARQFGLIIGNFADAILLTSEPLGKNLNEVSSKLNNFVVDIGKINLQGLSGTEIQEKLEAVFGAAADNMAKAAITGLDDFQKVGEGYFETIVRVASGIEAATAFTERLGLSSIKYTDIINKQGDVTTEIIRQSFLLVEKTKEVKGGVYDLVNAFDGSGQELTDFIVQLRELQNLIIATGKSGDFLSSTMALGAGGLDRLRDGLEAYFDMLSPQEQALELTRRMTDQFSALGFALPKSTDEFKSLVKGLDITTESGQKLFGKVIALAPEFTDLQDALESANSGVSDLVQSLRDLASEANKAIVDQNPILGLDQLRAQFATQAALAASGSTDAAKLLPQLGKDLMSVSKQFSFDGGQYAKDLAMIQRGATIAADVQQGGIGIIPATPNNITPNTSLTPIAASGTQSSVGSSGGATQADVAAAIDLLRVEMNANMFAIAKNTQRSKDLLEEWDDGGRMNVRVEQDATDSPLRVATTP